MKSASCSKPASGAAAAAAAAGARRGAGGGGGGGSGCAVRSMCHHRPMQQRIGLLHRCMRAPPVQAKPNSLAAEETRGAAGSASPSVAPLSLSEQRDRLQLYNTMSRSKQPFTTRPSHPDRVQMYVCGVTVYDFSHIGHARVYVAFDVLYRLLRALRYDVQYVRNFTDVDDKIIARAAANGEEPLALSRRFIEEFHKDMAYLCCLPPSSEPKATDFIPQMISTIQRIIHHGHAYAVQGDVFFNVLSLPGYGSLSGRSQEDNRAGERVDVDQRKRSPADFALWKAAKPGEPSWPSPWGEGRPGWHIECSSMIAEIMGDVIDIHGGGRDLVFPHHENELAQSRAASGCWSCSGGGGAHAHTHAPPADTSPSTSSSASSSSPGTDPSGGEAFVRYWLHNGFVNVDSEKMSKSLGNFFTIREVLAKYHPLALRWFLVSTHYRQQVNYTQRALEEASDRLYYVYQTLLDVALALEAAGTAGSEARVQAAAEFGRGAGAGAGIASAATLALLDDLNTPSAVSELSAPLKAANDLLTTKAGRKQPGRLATLAGLELGVGAVLGRLGLAPGAAAEPALAAAAPEPVAAAVLSGALLEIRQLALVRAGLSEADVQERIDVRAAARQAKDFARADEVRLELAALGLVIMDTPEGTTWRPVLPPA